MDLKTLSPIEAQTAIVAMDNIEDLREAAISLGIKFSGNSGMASLKGKLVDYFDKDDSDEDTDQPNQTDPISSILNGAVEDDEPIQVAKIKKKPGGRISDHDLIRMDANKIEDAGLRRQVVRAKALRMYRVKIQNLDPNDAPLSGGIMTISNKYTGKVSKYIPYGSESENGYYIPKILLDHLGQMKFPIRKEKKGNRFGVKQYQTVLTNKFNITYLDPLGRAELSELAALQRASHAIDN
jgi:hypothetical protein